MKQGLHFTKQRHCLSYCTSGRRWYPQGTLKTKLNVRNNILVRTKMRIKQDNFRNEEVRIELHLFSVNYTIQKYCMQYQNLQTCRTGGYLWFHLAVDRLIQQMVCEGGCRKGDRYIRGKNKMKKQVMTTKKKTI